MAQLTFLSGSPVMIDHTPGSAVTAGDGVVVNDKVFIAHSDIAANALGSVAAGGGVYRGPANAAIAKGKKVYWDDTNNEITETSSGNKVLGTTVSASAASDATVDVLHSPDTLG